MTDGAPTPEGFAASPGCPNFELKPRVNADGAGSGGVGGVLFPGFRVPPNDPSREIKPRAGLTASEPPRDMSDDYDDDGEEEACGFCEGWGYVDCHCGGDLCVCDYNGEIPCYQCG